VPRVVPDDMDIEIDLSAWTLPPVFQWLAKSGGVEEREMLRTFNCGIGMVAVVSPDRADEAARILSGAGERIYRLGRLIPGKGEPRVHYRGRSSI
jgi:phosphoribosylformylglycinamidine cyclo-ligase